MSEVILNLKWSNVDFKAGVIIVEGTRNGEIRKIPMTVIQTVRPQTSD
jgi:integrase